MSPERGAAQAKVVRRRPDRIVLVVACSQRKRVPAPDELRLAAIDAPPARRATLWEKRLREVEATQHAARDLYMGDHWHAAREAHRLAQQYSSRGELWILSAGYGLIPSSKTIKPYSATFATASPDSVWRGSQDGPRHQLLQRWWQGLPHEASLPDLLRATEDGAIVIAAGAAYLTAVTADLADLLDHEVGDDRVSVISAGTRGNGYLLPVDGRFRAAVGGTDAALNTRLLALLVSEAPAHRFRNSAMSAMLDRMAARLPTTDRGTGKAATDDQVARWIATLRRRRPAVSRTQALRELRQSGVACEQSRFASIWNCIGGVGSVAAEDAVAHALQPSR